MSNNMCARCNPETTDCFACSYANREVEDLMVQEYKKFKPVKHNSEMFVGTHGAAKLNKRRKG